MTDPTRQDQLDDGREPQQPQPQQQDPRQQERATDESGPGHDRPRGGATAATRGDGRRRSFWAGVREVLTIAATALVISFLIKTFLAQAFWIPSGSMEDTLVYGDRVMVSKIQAGPMTVERGDIAVFEDPGSWLSPSVAPDRGPVANAAMKVLQFVGIAPVSEGNHLIKRVIGVGGDTVACCDDQGRLTVNGQALDESDYLAPGDQPSRSEFEITVPEDSVWFMGDHRSNSQDSRAHDDGTGATGSVPRDKIVGQAFVLLFPLDHATWFRTPDTFDSVPEPSAP